MTVLIFCNLGSLVLGLTAWLLPLLAVGKKWRFACCCIGSAGCCAASLFLQLLEVCHRVHINDWSALLDTIDAVVYAAVVMLAVALAANVFALLKR